MSRCEYWVFGANGYLGNYISLRLFQEKCDLISLSRLNKSCLGIWKYFDITENCYDVLETENCDNYRRIAIICIAQSNIDKCKLQYDISYSINVTYTIELINKLWSKGFFVIFYSSDAVFSGEGNGYYESTEPDPINEYGKMKVIVEKHLLKNINLSCILRLSKVISPFKHHGNILTQMEEQAQSGSIVCIKDNKYHFVFIEDIYQITKIVANEKLTGIHHVVGNDYISREQLAKMQYTDGKKVTIISKYIDDFNFADKHALSIDIKNSKIVYKTGYIFKNVKEMIKEYNKD